MLIIIYSSLDKTNALGFELYAVIGQQKGSGYH